MGTFTFILEGLKKTKTNLRRDGRCSGRYSNQASLNKIGIISPYEHSGISTSTMNASDVCPRAFYITNFGNCILSEVTMSRTDELYTSKCIIVTFVAYTVQ